MNVLLTGASGLIGSALSPFLLARGHKVVPLRREPSAGGSGPSWNPVSGRVALNDGGPFDAVVHLAGESIGKRWSVERKRRIRQSRIEGTRILCEALAKLPRRPTTLVCASATGFYGNRGEAWLDESSGRGEGFLAEVCEQWEAAAQPAVACGIRVVHLRFGIVLASTGGALAKMLPVFRLGLGGRLGDGRSYWSWIALADVLGVLHDVLVSDSLTGPVNVVSPNPVTNSEFTRALGRVLGRPTFFAVPRFALELVFGEMGREALLASARVRPAKLLAAGYEFRHPELEQALRHVLGKEPYDPAGRSDPRSDTEIA